MCDVLHVSRICASTGGAAADHGPSGAADHRGLDGPHDPLPKGGPRGSAAAEGHSGKSHPMELLSAARGGASAGGGASVAERSGFTGPGADFDGAGALSREG